MKLAARLDHIEPFYVMECAKAAAELARSPACADSPMVFLNIGEPDFTAPPLVQEAAERALRGGRTQYTDATGLVALRERISRWYGERFDLDIAPQRRLPCSWPASRSSTATTKCCCPTRATRATGISSRRPKACRCCCRPRPRSASS